MSPLRLASAAALAGATLALSASVTAQPGPAMPTVNITLASHFYQPNPIYLAGGVPVRLVFNNRSGKTHDFKAPDFFRSARILRGSAPGGEVELGGGRGTVIILVPARGRYKVHCSQPFHTLLGMTGRIVVS
jgi:uncharacterized cupredoxin-like copper-binding protein